MQICDHLSRCAFYNDRLTGMPSDKDIMKSFYCRDKADRCARRMLAGKEPVEDNNNRLTPIGCYVLPRGGKNML